MKKCPTTNTNLTADQKKEKAAELWQQILKGSGMDHVPAYAEREKLKDKYREVLQAYEKGEATLDDLLAAAEGRFRAWYFRSAERKPLNHPPFSIFTAMLLHDAKSQSLCLPEIETQLVEKYGRCKGKLDGSYWNP